MVNSEFFLNHHIWSQNWSSEKSDMDRIALLKVHCETIFPNPSLIVCAIGASNTKSISKCFNMTACSMAFRYFRQQFLLSAQNFRLFCFLMILLRGRLEGLIIRYFFCTLPLSKKLRDLAPCSITISYEGRCLQKSF